MQLHAESKPAPQVIGNNPNLIYVKSAQADLTQKQIKALAQLMKDIDNG